MKKHTTKQITVCDICSQESDYPSSCDTCGKDVCWDCSDKHLVVYNHAVYFSGSGDAKYCRECDTKHRESGHDKRWNAYQKIKALREEAKAWSAAFRLRQDEAERAIKAFK